MNGSWRMLSIVAITLGSVASPRPAATAELDRWAYFQEIELPQDEAKYFDLLVPVSVFDGARQDLRDLRLFDAENVEVPYALRVLDRKTIREIVKAKPFNEATGPRDSSELSLELSENRQDHNRVDIDLPGKNFRRRALVEGSDDGENWVQLAEENLLRFEALEEEDTTIHYPASAFRYLRLRVNQDPEVDDEPVQLGSVEVSRHIDLPGEYVTREAALSPREAVKAMEGPGSAWHVDFGGRNVPVRWMDAHIPAAEFARDYQLQTPTNNRFYPFETIISGNWQRRREDERKPLAITLDQELRAHRLRLLVADHANPPLVIQRLTYSAPARQIVFENTGKLKSPLRLYYGNPQAQAPKYDFDRNLPQRREVRPVRLKLRERKENPGYVPPLKALTERWPWLVYVALTLVCLALAAIIVSIARSTIRLADHPPPAQPTPA